MKLELDTTELELLIAALDHYAALQKARDRDERPSEALLAKLRKARGNKK